MQNITKIVRGKPTEKDEILLLKEKIYAFIRVNILLNKPFTSQYL